MALPEVKRQIRRNARHLRLRVRADGIFLTLPPHVPEQVVQQFLHTSHAWLVQQWQAVSPTLPMTPLVLDGELLSFPACAQQWRVCLSEQCVAVVEQDGRLLVPIQQSVQCVKQWVLMQAKTYLSARLAQLAEQYGFDYRQCRVKHVTSRWGSCSSQRNINLNAALMLLPLSLIDYVLLHELCHTCEMNHGSVFWQHVQRVDPLFAEHRRQLKQVKLPSWWRVS